MSRPKAERPNRVQDLARLVGGRAALYERIDSAEVSRMWAAGLTDRQADRWAVAFGLDPYVVWPAMLDRAVDSVLVACARAGCGARFVPVRSDQVACSRPCARWVRNRRRRSREEVRAADRERSARYYEENREYVQRERMRRYFATRTQSVDTSPRSMQE